MDHETSELVQQLSAQVGMIMEDSSAQALILTDKSPDGLRATIAGLTEAAGRISAILEEAAALVR